MREFRHVVGLVELCRVDFVNTVPINLSLLQLISFATYSLLER